MDDRIKDVISKRKEIAALRRKPLDYGKAARIQRLEREIRDILAECRPALVVS